MDNLTRSQSPTGGWQRFQYDAAGRLVNVKTDAGAVIASYTYGASNQRLITTEGNLTTYYVWSGEATLAEYTEANSSGILSWSKSYVYLGARLLATLQPNGSGGESTQFHHPDRLETRLITNASDTNVQEQVSLPFGTALDAESTGSTNRRFTSYDRSASTGLDYAINRHYDSQQGRFTQVDPVGMGASSLENPQTLNLYAYCGNDPINHTDPDGLFWGKLFRFLGKALKWIAIAALVATAVITTIGLIAGPAALHTFLTTTLGKILSFVAGIPNRIGHFILGLPKTIAGIFSFAGEVSDRVAAMTGYGVLLGGGTTIGAIEKHQRKRRAERQRRRRSKEIEHRPDVNPGEIVGEVVGRAIAAIMARPIPQPPPTPTPEPPCPDYNPYPNYSGPYRGQYPAGYMPWKVPYGPDVERAYGDARGGPFNSRLSDASRAFGNSPWANCVRGCLLSAWNPCQQRYKPDFTTTHTICYGICTGSAILGEK